MACQLLYGESQIKGLHSTSRISRQRSSRLRFPQESQAHSAVLGAVDWVEELPPPHPFSSHVPANKLSKMIKWQAREESLRFLPASAIVSNPGAQNAAAGSKGLFSVGKGFVRSQFRGAACSLYGDHGCLRTACAAHRNRRRLKTAGCILRKPRAGKL